MKSKGEAMDIFKSMGVTVGQPQLVINAKEDEAMAKSIQRGDLDVARKGGIGNARENLWKGIGAKEITLKKSDALKDTNADSFHADVDAEKTFKKLREESEPIDSVFPGETKAGDPAAGSKGTARKSLSQEELLLKALGGIGKSASMPEPTLKKTKKGALVEWAKEEEAEPEHAKKSLFEKPGKELQAITDWEPTKESLLMQFSWKVKELNELKNSSWFMSSELDDSEKEMAEKLFAKLKREIKELTEQYHKAKKSFAEVDGKLEEINKAYMGFKKLAAKTSAAIAASVGRKKYGKEKFQEAAAQGKKLKKDESVAPTGPTVGSIIGYPGADSTAPKSMAKSALDELFDLVKGKKKDESVIKVSHKEDKKLAKQVADLHENSPGVPEQRRPMQLQRSDSANPFVKSVGKGGVVFDFGWRTGNRVADSATELLNQFPDNVQVEIARYQAASLDKSLADYVKSGVSEQEKGGDLQKNMNAHLSKSMDQQVEEAFKSGAFDEKGKTPETRFGKSEIVVAGEVVKATSETDAALIEMLKSQGVDLSGMEGGDIAGVQRVTVDATAAK